MASILDFLLTDKSFALFSKVSEKTGESVENISTVFGAALPLFLGVLQKKSSTGQGSKDLVAAIENENFEDEFLLDLNSIEVEIYSNAGKKFLSGITENQKQINIFFLESFGLKESSNTYILQTAAGVLNHILYLQKKNEKIDSSEIRNLIISNLGASSLYNRSLISIILDKNEQGNIIQDIEGRIIGGGQNDKNSDGGVLGGMLGGK